MNIELLREVQKAILDRPTAFDMSDFKNEQGRCGTTYCIGGWVCLIGNGTRFCGAEAQQLLDITPRQADQLFFSGDSSRFPNLWSSANTQEEAELVAKEAAARIDYFIETGE